MIKAVETPLDLTRHEAVALGRPVEQLVPLAAAPEADERRDDRQAGLEAQAAALFTPCGPVARDVLLKLIDGLKAL